MLKHNQTFSRCPNSGLHANIKRLGPPGQQISILLHLWSHQDHHPAIHLLAQHQHHSLECPHPDQTQPDQALFMLHLSCLPQLQSDHTVLDPPSALLVAQ